MPDSTPGHACELCGKSVDPAVADRYVSGWERSRSAGGTNAIRLREPQERFAHRVCVDLAASGINVAQGTLG